jgi:hypothetical protein
MKIIAVALAVDSNATRSPCQPSSPRAIPATSVSSAPDVADINSHDNVSLCCFTFCLDALNKLRRFFHLYMLNSDAGLVSEHFIDFFIDIIMT